MMELITKQDIITRWVAGWKDFYATHSDYASEKFMIGVMSLGSNPSEEDIISIGGDVSLYCDECNENVDAVVMFEDEEGWSVCLDCLKKAQGLVYATHNKV